MTGDEGRRRRLVVVAGAATRDLAADDPRGWRLGGGVVYGSLALARLGLPVAAYVGLDTEATVAAELDLLRRAGVEIRPVLLERGAVFENREGPAGREQRCHSWPSPIPPSVVEPALAAAAAGWLLAPIAAELPGGWAELPRSEALVALTWQGLLRRRAGGGRIERRAPASGPLVRRADLVGASVEDLGPRTRLGEAAALLRPSATFVVTAGERGGLVGQRIVDRWRWRRYRAVPSRGPVDPTGAGDVFLAVLLATRLEPGLVGGRLAHGADLLLAAAAASLVTERPGIADIGELAAIRKRLAALRTGRRTDSQPDLPRYSPGE